jgi:hypothetical protein
LRNNKALPLIDKFEEVQYDLLGLSDVSGYPDDGDTEMVLETVISNQLTRLMALDDFINFNLRESFRTHIEGRCWFS